MDRITKLEDRKYEKLKIHCVAIYIAWRLLNDFSQAHYVVQNGLQLLPVLLSVMPPYLTLKEETWTPLQSQFFWLWLLTFIINDKIRFKIRVLYKIPKSLLVCKKRIWFLSFSLFLPSFLPLTHRDKIALQRSVALASLHLWSQFFSLKSR